MNQCIDKKILRNRARILRKNSTDAESHLWQFLRYRSLNHYRFKRQVPIGNYIADFVCPWKKLVIEIDGGQHDENQNYDRQRTMFLESEGYKVIRFWNHEVMTETEEVLDEILSTLERK